MIFYVFMEEEILGIITLPFFYLFFYFFFTQIEKFSSSSTITTSDAAGYLVEDNFNLRREVDERRDIFFKRTALPSAQSTIESNLRPDFYSTLPTTYP